METISYIVAGLIAVLAMAIWIRTFHRWMRHREAVRRKLEEIAGGLDLADPAVRERLRTMLEAYNIGGSADIRDGKVYPPVPFDRMHPLLGLIDNANAALYRLKNPAACSLYVRDSMNDRFMLVPDLDLSDLREIAELLRAAVAERIRRKEQ